MSRVFYVQVRFEKLKNGLDQEICKGFVRLLKKALNGFIAELN